MIRVPSSMTRALSPKPAAAAVALALLVAAGCGAPSTGQAEGIVVHLVGRGDIQLERGPYYGGDFGTATGDITIDALDTGGRVTTLPPHDRLSIAATIHGPRETIEVSAKDEMVEDPLGRWTTWWGVGIDVDHHGSSGIGTNLLPDIHSDVAAFGMGSVSVAGRLVASGVPVHVMTADAGLPGRLELDVGDPMSPIPGLPDGHVRAIWSDYQGDVPARAKIGRYLGGGLVLLLLLIVMLWLDAQPPRLTAAARGEPPPR